MQLSDIPRNPDDKTLRQFGLIGLVVFGGAAASFWFRDRQGLALSVATFAMLFGVFGAFWPKRLKLVFVSWMFLAFPIGWLVSRIILAALFFLVFFPLGVILKLLGHDPLRLKQPPTDSYWEPRTDQPDLRRYFRQY